MSPALCASAEYNGVRVLRNPDATPSSEGSYERVTVEKY